MNDLIEIQYALGEARRVEPILKEEIEKLEDAETEYKKTIEEMKTDLANIQIKLADLREMQDRIRDSIKKLEKLEPMFLTEQDAVSALKTIRDQGKLHHTLYATESKAEQERFMKALLTVGGKGRSDFQDDMYIVEVVSVPDSYREFLYGENA